MSQQNEEKPVDLFLRNTTTTGQQKRTDVKIFISSEYREGLKTPYKDDHVMISVVTYNAHVHIVDEYGRCHLIMTPETMGKMIEINNHFIYAFNSSKLDLFVKNYDHFVNAFKKISESYTINDDQFTGMTVFGQNPLKPVIAINKIDRLETVTTHNVGYYVSKQVKDWIKENNRGYWTTNSFSLSIYTRECFKRDDGKLVLGVYSGEYMDISSHKAGLSIKEQKCFIDNFNMIAEGFKALKIAFDSRTIVPKNNKFDTTDGIVF